MQEKSQTVFLGLAYLIKKINPLRYLSSGFAFLLKHSTQKVEIFGAPYGLFVLFTVSHLCFIPFVFSSGTCQKTMEFLVYLRASVNLFCFILIMKDFWPKRAIKYMPLFWHFTLFFCLPYFAMTTCLFTSCAIEWVICLVLTIFILGIPADWKTYLWSLVLGAIFSSLSFVSFGCLEAFDPNLGNFPVLLYATIVSIFVGAVFSRNREQLLLQKLATSRALGGTIAHEMRTPLSSIYISAKGLDECLPRLLIGYHMAKNHGLPVPTVSRLALESAENCPERLRYICASTLNIIDMLLFQLKDIDWQTHFTKCSIKNCVSTALSEYGFREKELELLDTVGVLEFDFIGNESLVVHIIFNLMRNSLAFIHSEKKGSITIWTTQSNGENKLHFRDTAKGISEQDITQIFEHGFSKRPGGSGVGLYYCRQMMKTMQGSIVVESVEGQSCEFILTFANN